mmetsp:Transcript_26009/g.36145  ORF Transcript_26009/g.36145 Transcript_26009/m.36145 type:complete len:788 (-) Transcript_26009:20-2383(-)
MNEMDSPPYQLSDGSEEFVSRKSLQRSRREDSSLDFAPIFDETEKEYGERDPLRRSQLAEVESQRIRSYFKKKQDMSDKVEGAKQFLRSNISIWVFVLVMVALLVTLRFTSSIWEELQWRGWLAVVLTIFMMVLLILEIWGPAFVFMIVQTLVLLIYYTWDVDYAVCSSCTLDTDSDTDLPMCEEITTSRAVAGFSNSGVLTVAILFVVAKGIELSSILKFFIKYVLRKPTNLLDAQVRLLIPVLFFSAFLNNTPIVAMMIPVIESWAVQCHIPASYLLMPLSFAAIMGGTCSLIGTSSNVIIAGLVDDDSTKPAGFEIGFFSMGYVGFPAACAGLIYIFIFSRLLLPGPKGEDEEMMGSQESLGKGRQLFTVPIMVTQESNLVKRTLKKGGLVDMSGVKVLKISTRSSGNVSLSTFERQDDQEPKPSGGFESVEDPPPDYVISAGDIIYFSGNWEAVQTVFALDGVVPATLKISEVVGKRYNRSVVHVVLSNRSEMVGMTISEADFLHNFNAAVVAVSRQDLPVLLDDLDDVILESGDVLVLETTIDFKHQFATSSQFALISEKRGGSLTPRRISFSMFFVVTLAVVMISLSAADVLNLLAGAFLVSTLYIIAGVLTWEQAKGAVNADVLFVIAAAFGLGNLLQDTCAANAIAESLLVIFEVGGEIGVLAGLYLTVALMSAVISNSATVTLMYPIAINFADCNNKVSVSYDAAVYVLMLAGSACFATPIGYQTNLMVMSPGNYSTKDFLKFGIPLTIVNMVVVCVMARFLWASDCPSNSDVVSDGT